MKFLSVCSGIEAVTVAWAPLGIEPVAYAEIEPYPSAVLARRCPDTPNLGDMTKYDTWNIPPIDILAGGTPCQSFSVAGKRGGLTDDRGNLCLVFCAIADKFDPAWVLWENVPGVLNTLDNSFGCFLGKLCGGSDALPPPDGRRFPPCGVVSGPARTVAWRVMDAQWHGVPQRRRRLYVLAGRGTGNWACADALLPFRDSLPGYFTPRAKTRKTTSPRTGTGPQSSHWNGGPHPTLDARKSGIGLSDQELFAQRGACLVRDISPAVTAKWAWAKGSGAPAANESCNLTISLAPPLWESEKETTILPQGSRSTDAGRDAAICFGLYENQRAKMRHYEDSQPTFTCGGGKAGQGTNMVFLYENHAQDNRVAGPLLVSPACTAHWGTGGGNTPLVLRQPLCRATGPREDIPEAAVRFCCPIDTRTLLRKDSSPSSGPGLGEDGAPSHTLTAQGHTPGVAYAIQGEIADGRRQTQNGMGITEDISYTLTASAVHSVSACGCVRRLMPVECERLQGFPDNWTYVEKKPGAGCPDSPRYKAIGNSMAVPVIRWIGRQIQKNQQTPVPS